MPLIEDFFNKSKYSVTKLSEQVVFAPDQEFTLPVFILDVLRFKEPVAVAGELVKIAGRNITELPTIVTTDKLNGRYYNFTATPASVDWDGTTSLQLRVIITLGIDDLLILDPLACVDCTYDNTVLLPLVTKA